MLEESRAPLAPAGAAPSEVSAERRLTDFFGVRTLDGFGALTRAEIAAAALAVGYIERTQIGVRPPLRQPTRLARGAAMEIDAATRANLELTRTLGGAREASLLACIDVTVTSAGGRALAERLAAPLTDAERIGARLDAVQYLLEAPQLRERLRAHAHEGRARHGARAGAHCAGARRSARSRGRSRRLQRVRGHLRGTCRGERPAGRNRRLRHGHRGARPGA